MEGRHLTASHSAPTANRENQHPHCSSRLITRSKGYTIQRINLHSRVVSSKCRAAGGARGSRAGSLVNNADQLQSNTDAKPRPRLAVFVSGGGSNFRRIHKQILEHSILADISVVVSDVPHCGACKYAAEHRIPIVRYPASQESEEHSSEHNAASPKALRELLLAKHHVDFVILAGYLKLVPKEVVAAFPRAMVNIHPGFLPTFGGKGFYGERVHKAVIASGVRFTGPTVHFVDENYDTGPIIAQRAIPVSPCDDHKHLAARVLKEEHILYPEVVSALVDGRITWRSDGIPIMWKPQ